MQQDIYGVGETFVESGWLEDVDRMTLKAWLGCALVCATASAFVRQHVNSASRVSHSARVSRWRDTSKGVCLTTTRYTQAATCFGFCAFLDSGGRRGGGDRG